MLQGLQRITPSARASRRSRLLSINRSIDDRQVAPTYTNYFVRHLLKDLTAQRHLDTV
jgi:hypothetical protein